VSGVSGVSDGSGYTPPHTSKVSISMCVNRAYTVGYPRPSRNRHCTHCHQKYWRVRPRMFLVGRTWHVPGGSDPTMLLCHTQPCSAPDPRPTRHMSPHPTMLLCSCSANYYLDQREHGPLRRPKTGAGARRAKKGAETRHSCPPGRAWK